LSLVVLVSVDGLRPDALSEQEHRFPTFAGMRAAGAWTLHASSVMPSITLPCHMSMFHSLPPQRHGVTSNTWQPVRDGVPGLIDLAHSAGLRTAMFYNWEKIRGVSMPGSLSYATFIDSCKERRGDEVVCAEALRYLDRHPCDFIFIYCGALDEFAHKHDWMSEHYFDHLEIVDGILGGLLQALPEGARVLVQSDHGGHDYTHGTQAPQDMTIPWMVKGPDIRAGHQIQAPVSMLDTAPTLAHLLGLEPPPAWQGHPIEEIFT